MHELRRPARGGCQVLPVVWRPGRPAASFRPAPAANIRLAPECAAKVVAGQARPFGQNHRPRRGGRNCGAHALFCGRLGNPLYRGVHPGVLERVVAVASAGRTKYRVREDPLCLAAWRSSSGGLSPGSLTSHQPRPLAPSCGRGVGGRGDHPLGPA